MTTHQWNIFATNLLLFSIAFWFVSMAVKNLRRK